MYIQWDEPKRRRNLRDHGVDFADLERFFAGDLLTRDDQRYPYAELRLQSLGMLEETVLFVAWASAGVDGEIARVISARKATTHEAQEWFRRCSKRH